jgi:hypothetical protein
MGKNNVSSEACHGKKEKHIPNHAEYPESVVNP